ncbi:MAG: CatB-related O-acetyltransferase [Deltaproteobacteria bacterium]|nr:CatB-related O-acetyltransferase [Deltaproteobacteria bacterium]
MKNCKVKIDCEFEGHNAVFHNTEISNSILGLFSYVAENSVIRSTKIGRFCAIGDYVRTGVGRHPIDTMVSIHPAFFSLKKQAGITFAQEQLFHEHLYVDAERRFVVDIGNDVWIGNNVTIMDGIIVSDGAVIGAGAVVTKDVAPYCVVGGIPARAIRYRFSKEERKFLQEFKWWEKDVNWLARNAHLFCDIEKFMKNVG